MVRQIVAPAIREYRLATAFLTKRKRGDFFYIKPPNHLGLIDQEKIKGAAEQQQTLYRYRNLLFSLAAVISGISSPSKEATFKTVSLSAMSCPSANKRSDKFSNISIPPTFLMYGQGLSDEPLGTLSYTGKYQRQRGATGSMIDEDKEV